MRGGRDLKPDEVAGLLAGLGSVVDAHHHFWDLGRNRYPWLQERPVQAHFGDYAAIRRNYLPSDLKADSAGIQLDATVHVEAHWQAGRDPADETRWLQGLTQTTGWPTARVGFADLLAPDLDLVLQAHLAAGGVAGLRMLTRRGSLPSGEDLMRSAAFVGALALLGQRGLSFDLQADPSSLAAAADLAAQVPQTRLILTHAGLPLDRSPEGLALWHDGISRLATRGNVWAKLSGLPMTDWHWTAQSLRPFVQHLVQSFGPQRVMFGSNFPVDGLFSTYPVLVAGYLRALDGVSSQDLHWIFSRSARAAYRLREASGGQKEETAHE